jgi:hypothetical protein
MVIEDVARHRLARLDRTSELAALSIRFERFAAAEVRSQYRACSTTGQIRCGGARRWIYGDDSMTISATAIRSIRQVVPYSNTR